MKDDTTTKKVTNKAERISTHNKPSIMGNQDRTAKRGSRRWSGSIDRLASVTGVLLALSFLGGKPVNARFGFAPKTRLTWVNGVGYNEWHMEKEAPVIARYFGGKKVEFYHNPTQMIDESDTKGYLRDMSQAGQQKYLGKITEEVNGLVEHLKAAVRSIEKHNGIVVHIAHSQGALVTCLAAKQLTPIEMSKIEVIAFGGATPVRSTPETPFRRCVNYYSLNDPLLFLNPSAESALRSGFNHHFYSSTTQKANEDEFCFLAPRMGDPIADHKLLNPTYASALEWEGRRFERKYQSYLQRTVRLVLLTSLSTVTMIFQFVSLLWQKLITVVLELRIRLRRALVRSLVVETHALRLFMVAVMTRILSFVRGLWEQSQSSPSATPIVAEEFESTASLAQNLLLADSSPSVDTLPKVTADTDPLLKQAPFFGFRRETKITPVAKHEEPENKMTSKFVTLKSWWLLSKENK